MCAGALMDNNPRQQTEPHSLTQNISVCVFGKKSGWKKEKKGELNVVKE